MNDIAEQVRRFVIDRFMFGQGGDGLSNEDSFLDKGLIDSTGVLEMVAYLEQTFALQIADDELIPDNLDSITRVAEFVARKRSG